MIDKLTNRETDVLRLMVEGLSNREIATHLYLTFETVRWYCKQLYSKLDVHNRRAAIRKAKELGLFSQKQATPPPQHNLPADITPFVGRQDELHQIHDLIQSPNIRLVTILATGGMGKTRLALAVARQSFSDLFRDGVFFIPLAALSDPGNIASAIAEDTNFQFQGDNRSRKQQILDYLQKKRMLLLLDNFEHLLEGADIIIEILEFAPQVKIIVTSREHLNLRGATVFTIGGMALPNKEATAAVQEYDAIQLLLQGVRQAKPDFAPTSADLDTATHICQLVEGMPLAIVLAAAWSDVLTLPEIRDEIGQSITFLATEMRDLPVRHRSIQAVLAPTWERLSEKEQEVFMRFSIFRGGCTRAAAQAVTGADLRLLQTLINRLLIHHNERGRYEMHELVRQYAAEQLKNAKEIERLRTAHSDYYSDFMQEQESYIKGRDQQRSLNAVEIDFMNVQAAWQWALQQDLPTNVDKMLESVYWFCTFRSRLEEGAQMFQQARQRWPVVDNPIPLIGRLLVRFPQTGQDMTTLYEQSLAITRQHHDQHEIAYVLQQQGKHLSHHQHDQRGLLLLEESLAIYEALDEAFYAAHVLDDMGWSLALAGKRDERFSTIQRSIDLRQQCGDKIGEAAARRNLSSTYMMLGRVKEANQLIQEARLIARQINDQTNLTWTTLMYGARLALQGESEASQSAIDEGLALAINMNNPGLKRLGSILLGLLQGTLGDYGVGKRTIEQVIHYEDLEQTDVAIRIFACVAGSICEYGLGNIDTAKRLLKIGLDAVTNIVPSPAMITWYCPILVLVLAHAELTERMIEVLALTLTHPARHCWWADNWLPIVQLQQELKSELGETAFVTAWERGQSFDLFEVIKMIMAEFFDVKSD